MLSTDRQEKIEKVISRISVIPGVRKVETDDFDSTSVNVFVELQHEQQPSGRYGPTKFVKGIRWVKSKIREAHRQAGFDFNFINQPKKRYESNGPGPKHDLGYDQTHILIETFV